MYAGGIQHASHSASFPALWSRVYAPAYAALVTGVHLVGPFVVRLHVLAAPRASPEIKEACKRTSKDGGFVNNGWLTLSTRRGHIQICWLKTVTAAIQI